MEMDSPAEGWRRGADWKVGISGLTKYLLLHVPGSLASLGKN